MSECKCEFRIRILGDGCKYCQPQTYIDMMERCNAENRAEDEALLRQALQEFESFTHGSGGLYEGEFKEIVATLRERLKENP